MVLGPDKVLRPGALPCLDTHNEHAHVANMRARQRMRCMFDSDATVRSRQSFWALCRDRVLRVATWFPGQQGGLGRDRGFLYRDRDFLALCHDRNSVSRQGLGMGQAWVMKRVSLCRDRVFPRLGHSCRDRVSKGGVATGCFFVATHRPGLRARQSVGRAHDIHGYARKRAHQRWWCCTRDSAHSVHTTARTIGVTGTLSRKTCPVAKKNDPLDLGRHTKAITPIFYNIQSIKQKNG